MLFGGVLMMAAQTTWGGYTMADQAVAGPPAAADRRDGRQPGRDCPLMWPVTARMGDLSDARADC